MAKTVYCMRDNVSPMSDFAVHLLLQTPLIKERESESTFP